MDKRVSRQPHLLRQVHGRQRQSPGSTFIPTLAEKEHQRRFRKLAELFVEMAEFERTQLQVDELIAALERLDPMDRYAFEGADGSELLSRWDMQDNAA